MHFLSTFAALALCATASASALPPRAPHIPAIPFHLRCVEDSDCVIRDVGNCCGYYPQCANATAELPPSCPDGGMSICGFPVIEGCECQNGRCRSV